MQTRGMRKLIVIPSPLIMRDFVAAGAFEAIDDEETYYLSPPLPGLEAPVEDLLDRQVHYAGEIVVDESRRRAYDEIRQLLLTSYRFRSRTSRMKLKELPLLDRWRAKARAAPLVRQRRIRRLLRVTGLHSRVHEVMTAIGPDVVIAVSRGPGGDVVVIDAMRSARALGIPVLALTNNWDNLSSKNAFAIRPDYLGAIGNQSAEHATKIHRIPSDRIQVIGSPYIDRYFRHLPGEMASPLPFRYVLFAGCYRPFDERRALEILDRAVEESRLDLKIVYLPHPRRVQRRCSDYVDEGRLRHVVIEPHVRDDYLASWSHADGVPRAERRIARTTALSLDLYPALLENADFVVCPLSTMMLEAAIFRRRVLVIAYHDGLHRTSPGHTIKYLHFERVDTLDTFEVCRQENALAPMFAAMAADEPQQRRPPKHQMDYWIYHDEQPFSERLRQFVEEIVTSERRSG